MAAQQRQHVRGRSVSGVVVTLRDGGPDDFPAVGWQARQSISGDGEKAGGDGRNEHQWRRK